MTGLLESGVRKPFICLGPTTEVSAHSVGHEEVPRVWPFNATEKLDPDVRELLSMHCSWCVLDYGEAQWLGSASVDALAEDDTGPYLDSESLAKWGRRALGRKLPPRLARPRNRVG